MVSLEIGMVVHRSVSMASFWFEVRYAAMILCCGGVDAWLLQVQFIFEFEKFLEVEVI